MDSQEIGSKEYELSRRRKVMSMDRNRDWDRRDDDMDESERRRRLGKSRKSGKIEKDKEPGGGSEYKIDLFENSDEEKESDRRVDKGEGSGDESDGKHSSAKRKNGNRGKKVVRLVRGKIHDAAVPADRVFSEPKERGSHDPSFRVSKEEMEAGYYMEEGGGGRKAEVERGWKKGDYRVEEEERGLKEFGNAEDHRSRKIEEHLERAASFATAGHSGIKTRESLREVVKSEGGKDVSAGQGEADNFKPVEKKRTFKEKSRQERDEREQDDRRNLVFDDSNEARGKGFDRDDKGAKRSKRFREKPAGKGEKFDGAWEETQEALSNGKTKEGSMYVKTENLRVETDDGKGAPRIKRGATIAEEERRGERVTTRERFGEEWDESEDGVKGGASGPREAKTSKYGTSGERIEGGWEDVNSVGRASGRGRGDRDEERTYRQKGVKERVDPRWEESGDGSRLWARGRGDDEIEKQRGRDREMVWEEPEDGGRSGGRSRPARRGKGSWSPDGRRGQWKGEWEDYDRDWSDDRDDFEKTRNTGRLQLDRDRDYRERPREKDYDWIWERDKGRDWDETSDRQKNGRYSERLKDRDALVRDADHDMERADWDLAVRRDKPDRRRLEHDSSMHDTGERDRKDRTRVENLRSPQRHGITPESSSRGSGAAGKLQPGGQFQPRGGEQFVMQNEYLGFAGEGKWDSHLPDDRLRISDAIYVAGDMLRDRFNAGDDEGPPGLDHGFGPAPGRGGGDAAMGYSNFHGRGRGPKGSPGNRGRGGMMGPDVRPFVNNQNSGPGLRGSQQGDKVGRGNRGRGVKSGRGGGRDGQRGNGMPPLMAQGPGPGMGPHFGPFGPSGPLPVLGPGVGLVPGPGMGPGNYSMPPFGGPMGWGNGRGVGELGMMAGPSPAPVPGPGPMSVPRFNPNMGVAPGPPKFFTAPGTQGAGRGGPPPGPLFAGNPQFAGRGIPSERGPSGGRGVVRISTPAGRGPSRGEQNDYSQHFVDTGLRPQNFIRDVELADRFEEYPKLKELITRKDKLISDRATPPMYLQCDLRATELTPELFGSKFDVILVDPPWEEYVRRAPGVGDSMESWTAEEIQNLRIEAIADTPAFIFLWVGDAEGLDQGRNCLKKWGFRRCEDICWVKTNKENPTPALRHDANTLFQHSKEHCLMGIKGTVRRSIDGHIIHANIDTDIIISDEPSYGSVAKPEELYHIIEHFALGQRRLELFGEDHNIRAGWVTAGKGLSSSNFNPQIYAKYFADVEGKVWQGGRGNPPVDAVHLVGTTPEIEALRPKSPPPRPPQQQSQVGNSVPQSSTTNGNTKKTATALQGTVAFDDQQMSASGQGTSIPPVSTSEALGQVSGHGGGSSPKQNQCLLQPAVETSLNVTVTRNGSDAVLEAQSIQVEANHISSEIDKALMDVPRSLEIGTKVIQEAVLNFNETSQSEARKLEVHSTVELSCSMHSQATYGS